MKVGMLDVDGHKWPNLCQMKLSAYHKLKGDTVERWTPEGRYDVVYKSKVFTDLYSRDNYDVRNAEQVICGGTGYGSTANLPDEIEHCRPDYDLYPEFPDTAYGFLTRGCPRSCGFCLVSGKEGTVSRKVANLSEFWDGQREIKLLDPNLLACSEHEDLLVQLAESRAFVDFSQGLDIRLTTPDNAALLNKIRVKRIHFAWDNPNQDLTSYFQRFSKWCKIRDYRRKAVYVLTNWSSTHEQDLWRVHTLRELGYSPYIMVFDKPNAPQITRHLQRWVNNKRIFNTVTDFRDYLSGKEWRELIESKKNG